MPDFVLAYHGNKRPADGANFMKKWKSWVEGLGDALVDPGLALGMSITVSADGVFDGGGANPLAGFTVVRAKDRQSAIKIAQACPHLEIGTIEIAQDMQMSMGPDKSK